MLAYFTAEGAGASDRLLAALADDLKARGLRLAGAVQVNTEVAGQARRAMDLRVLPSGEVVRISQNLGAGATGCRLDPDGLERAAGLVLVAQEASTDLVIVNKFGKQEADLGRGFRPVIERALLDGVPAIVAVAPGHRAAFQAFAEDFAEEVRPDQAALTGWALAAVRNLRARA